LKIYVIYNKFSELTMLIDDLWPKWADVHSGTTNVPLHFSCSNLFITCVRRRGVGTSQLVLPYQVFCDASEIGFGGHLTTGSEDEPVEIYGSWFCEEQAQSSTWRELEAVNRVLRNVINKLHGKFVRV
jgi:hypothetical protein